MFDQFGHSLALPPRLWSLAPVATGLIQQDAELVIPLGVDITVHQATDDVIDIGLIWFLINRDRERLSSLQGLVELIQEGLNTVGDGLFNRVIKVN